MIMIKGKILEMHPKFNLNLKFYILFLAKKK